MLNFTKIILGSSNPGKLKEYNSFGLTIKSQSIPDLPEVLGTEEEVIIYKAISAGENILVEDTSLSIEGFEVGVNVKWLTEDLKTNPKYHGASACWLVYLGVVQDGMVYLAKGELKGVINFHKSSKDSFGFDSVFVPEGQELSLHELNIQGYKEGFSARKIAITKLLNQQCDKELMLATIPEWDGEYQS